jgi:hypothetical protein
MEYLRNMATAEMIDQIRRLSDEEAARLIDYLFSEDVVGDRDAGPLRLW